MAITQGHKLDASTLALWRLDEPGATDTAIDAVGSNPLTVGGGSTVVVTPGLIADGGRAHKFTSAVSYLGAATSGALDTVFAGEVTFEAWVTLSSTWSRLGILGGYTSTALPGLEVEIQANQGFRCVWGKTGGTQETFASGALLVPLNVRTHIAIRRKFDPGGATTRCEAFVNGVSVAVTTGLANPVAFTGNLLAIGSQSGSFWFEGTVDDVRMSKVARTDAEISESYWRGLIDISPGPTLAPFRQNRTPYQDYHRQISPTALLNPNGAAFEAAQGSVKDAVFDRCLQAVKAKYPSVAPADALAAIGADRSMPRGGSESDAAYAARLLNAWNTWPWAGTAYGVLQAFWSTGYRNVVLAQVRGGKQFTLDTGSMNLAFWSQRFEKWFVHGGGQANGYTLPSADTSVAPDGTTTADTISTTASTPGTGFGIFEDCTGGPNGQYTFSVWLRSGTASSAQLFIKDCSTDTIRSTATCALTSSWQRFSVTGTTSGGTPGVRIEVQVNTATGTIIVWGAQAELGSSPGPYSITDLFNKPTSLGAGVLLTSSSGTWCPTWTTDPFWSRFDVLFPLPLMPPSWGWAGGIPGSSSAEANFIRALIAAWRPAHATCNRIVIVQQGSVWGYPASGTWGEAGDVWGSDTETVWTP